MTVPTINAIINFSTGPAFAQAFLIDSGILGTNVLADAAAVIVDVSNQVNYVQTSSGRSPLVDQFQTGQLTLRIVDQNGDFNPTNVSSPYYGLLTPMKKVQITATYNGTTYPIFSGFITSYVNTQPKDATEVAYTTINLRATTINTLFGSNNQLQATLTVEGRDSGARLTIPVTVTKVS